MAPQIISISIGTTPEYNFGDDWNLYIERFDQYFVGNFIDENFKVLVLIIVIGAKAYAVLRELCDPISPNTLSHEDLCNLLKKQFSPKVAVLHERTKFYNLKQLNNESVNTWYIRIKISAINYNFSKFLTEKLKDNFVTGLSSVSIM